MKKKKKKYVTKNVTSYRTEKVFFVNENKIVYIKAVLISSSRIHIKCILTSILTSILTNILTNMEDENKKRDADGNPETLKSEDELKPQVYFQGKNFLETAEYVKQNYGMYVSSSRMWVLTYSVLTWLMTIAFFCVVNFYAYGLLEDRDPASTLQKRGIVQSIGCLSRKSFVEWNTVFELYKTYDHTTVTESALLKSVLDKMHCGVPSTVSSSIIFSNSSFQCPCAIQYHNSIYKPKLEAIIADSTLTTAEDKANAIRAWGEEYSEKGVKDDFPSLMQMCFFSYRPAQWMEVDSSCWSEVVPYAMIMYVNTISGFFAGLYFVVYWGKSNGKSDVSGNGKMLRYAALAFFGVVNMLMGLWAIIVAFQSQDDGKTNGPALGMYITAYILTLAVVLWAIYSILENMFSPSPPSSAAIAVVEDKGQQQKKQLKEQLKESAKAWYLMAQNALRIENGYVIMRMLFWVQYILCAPVLLLLYDGLHHTSRFSINAWSRLLMTLGLGFVAFGFDICLAIHEKQQLDIYAAQEENAAQVSAQASQVSAQASASTPMEKMALLTICTGDNARSSTWWAWSLWIVIATSLFGTSLPIEVSSQWLETTVPGSTTLIAAAVVLYMIGMPIIARVPGMNIESTIGFYWMEDRHATSLSLCLVVDFVTRTLITLTMTYWLIFETV